jgi:ABC-type dipeptide/oligopeptide/nickel transport system ATPase subunit
MDSYVNEILFKQRVSSIKPDTDLDIDTLVLFNKQILDRIIKYPNIRYEDKLSKCESHIIHPLRGVNSNKLFEKLLLILNTEFDIIKDDMKYNDIYNLFTEAITNYCEMCIRYKDFDIEKANKIAAERMAQRGIDVRDPSQAVGTMSGGERQCLAISRAIYFGAKVLVLDEPTSALGVHQASVVLKYIVKAASQGLAVILITHNVHHAYPVGNSFTVLNRGKSLGTYKKKDITREKLLSMMAGGEELDKLEVELQEMNRAST